MSIYFLHCIKKFGHFFELKDGRGTRSRGSRPGMYPDTQIREDFSIRHLAYLPELFKDLKLTKIAKNSRLLREFDLFTRAPWRTWCRSGQFLPMACTCVQEVYAERIPRSRIDVLVFKCTTAFFTRAWGKCTVSIRAKWSLFRPRSTF